MSKIKDALWNDYKMVSDLIKQMSIESDGYSMVLEERDRIRNELLKLEQIEQERGAKESQIQAENKREKVRNRITIGTTLGSIGVSVWMVCKTFKFDQTSTVTSTLGRNILNGIVPKMMIKR